MNAEGPAVIARWAALRGVPLIHFSTDYVFNGAGERAWREDDEVQPLSVYGSSKLAGENAVRAAGGISLVIRTSWVYAARGANFLRAITRLARERKELRIVADQIGAPTSAAVISDGVIAMLSGGSINSARAAAKPTGSSISWRRARPAGMALRQRLSRVSRSGTSCLRSNMFGRSPAPNIPPARPVRITRGLILPACIIFLGLRLRTGETLLRRNSTHWRGNWRRRPRSGTWSGLSLSANNGHVARSPQHAFLGAERLCRRFFGRLIFARRPAAPSSAAKRYADQIALRRCGEPPRASIETGAAGRAPRSLCPPGCS